MDRPSPKGLTITYLKALTLKLTNPLQSMTSQLSHAFALHMLTVHFKVSFHFGLLWLFIVAVT